MKTLILITLLTLAALVAAAYLILKAGDALEDMERWHE